MIKFPTLLNLFVFLSLGSSLSVAASEGEPEASLGFSVPIGVSATTTSPLAAVAATTEESPVERSSTSLSYGRLRDTIISITRSMAAKEEDLYVFFFALRQRLEEGKSVETVNPLFSGSFEKDSSNKCRDFLDRALKTTCDNYNAALSQMRLADTLSDKEGATEYFNALMNTRLNLFASCYFAKVTGDKASLSTTPEAVKGYSEVGKFIAQSDIDLTLIFNLMLRALYPYIDEALLTRDVAVALAVDDDLRAFMSTSTITEMDPWTQVAKVMPLYYTLTQHSSLRTQQMLHNIAQWTPPEGKLREQSEGSTISPPRSTKGLTTRERLQRKLQERQSQNLTKAPPETVQPAEVLAEAGTPPPASVSKSSQKKKRKKAPHQEHPANSVNTSPVSTLPLTSLAPPLLSLGETLPLTRAAKEEEEEKEPDSCQVSPPASPSLAAATALPARPSPPKPAPPASLASPVVASPIPGGIILHGKIYKLFARFWRENSTGAGLNFDHEFEPLFNHLGGRIEVSGRNHRSLYFTDFPPEGTWRPHPCPTLGHSTMLLLREVFRKWGLTLDKVTRA